MTEAREVLDDSVVVFIDVSLHLLFVLHLLPDAFHPSLQFLGLCFVLVPPHLAPLFVLRVQLCEEVRHREDAVEVGQDGTHLATFYFSFQLVIVAAWNSGLFLLPINRGGADINNRDKFLLCTIALDKSI
jgi:hypothetical protein